MTTRFCWIRSVSVRASASEHLFEVSGRLDSRSLGNHLRTRFPVYLERDAAHADGSAGVVVDLAADLQTGQVELRRVAALVSQVVEEGLDVDRAAEARADVPVAAIAGAELEVTPSARPIVALVAQRVLLVPTLNAGTVVDHAIAVHIARPATSIPAPPTHDLGVNTGAGVVDGMAFAQPELPRDIPRVLGIQR